MLQTGLFILEVILCSNLIAYSIHIYKNISIDKIEIMNVRDKVNKIDKINKAYKGNNK